MVLELKSGDDIIETLNTIRKDSNLIVVFEDFGGYTTKPFDCDSHTNFFNKNSEDYFGKIENFNFIDINDYFSDVIDYNYLKFVESFTESYFREIFDMHGIVYFSHRNYLDMFENLRKAHDEATLEKENIYLIRISGRPNK